MHVGSLLEVYTTMFGWSLYGTFFEVLSITGFLYYPLFMALYKNWKEPIMSQDDKPASIISQRRMTYDVIAILLVFSFAIVPFANLEIDEVHYRVACTDSAGGQNIRQDVSGGATGTTFDHHFDDNSVVRIPALWWLVLNVSGGINQAVMSSFRCFEDIKGLDQQLRNLTIKDPILREEYSRFATECYLPAKSKFIRSIKGGDYHDYVKLEREIFYAIGGAHSWLDETDPFFIGSRFYLNTSGFYNWDGFNQTNCANTVSGCSMQARAGVPGWTHRSPRDDGKMSNEDVAAGNPGFPECDEWWLANDIGLKNKLVNSIEASKIEILNWDSLPGTGFLQKVRSLLENSHARYRATFLDQPGALEDLIIKRYSAVDPPSFNGGDYDFSEAIRGADARDINEQTAMAATAGVAAVAVGSGVAAGAAALGAAKMAVDLADTMKDFYVTMFIVKNAAPMIQATLLMMLYGLMIFYFVISEYDIDSIITMIFLILGVRFFTSLWVFADYIDARLYTSMYPDVSHLGSVLTQGINRYLLDMVFTILYIAVPALFLFIITLAGQRISKMGGSAGDMSNPMKNIRMGGIGKLGK